MIAYDTVKDYIRDARVLLQDRIRPYRYDDTSLVTALNAALLEGRRIRADLYIGLRHLPQYTEVDDEEVPIEPQFRSAFVHYLVAHALERDQEDIQDARSSAFTTVFYVILLGISSPGIKSPAGGGQGNPAQS